MHPKYHVYHNKKYESWIRKQPCLVCKQQSEVHHLWHTGGKEWRNAYNSIPLCPIHHTMGPTAYHNLEHDAFESHHSKDLLSELVNYLQRYIDEYLQGNIRDIDDDTGPECA